MSSNEQQKKMAPKCARCRNHGFVVELKGHTRKCPFLPCVCWKCSLVTERTRIMASQRRIRNGQANHSDRPVTASRAETAGSAVRSVAEGPSHRVPSAGKTYSELQATDHSIEHAPEPHTVRGMDNPVNTGHFPWEYTLREMSQKSTYPGEMLAMPLPMQMCSWHPDNYAYPAFLLSLPPPPPGDLQNAVAFPGVSPTVLDYSPEPGIPQEGSVSCYAPYSPYPWVQEECRPDPYHYHVSSMENVSGTEQYPQSQCDTEMVGGSQEIEVIVIDNDFSSKDTT